MRTFRLLTDAGAVRLRSPARSDGRRWRELRLADENILRKVEPTVGVPWADAHTLREFRRFRRRWHASELAGTGISAVIDLDDEFVGMVTIGGIQPFPISTCWIGYWVSSEYVGKGIATAALALACDYAASMGVHRIEATVRADNTASIKVLKNCGFVEEGVAREAFHMDHAWRDHLMLSNIDGARTVDRLVEAGKFRREAAPTEDDCDWDLR